MERSTYSVGPKKRAGWGGRLLDMYMYIVAENTSCLRQSFMVHPIKSFQGNWVGEATEFRTFQGSRLIDDVSYVVS